MHRRTYLAATAALFSCLALPPGVLALVGCSRTGWARGVAGFDGDTMGTGYALRVVPPREGIDLEALRSDVGSTLGRIDGLMSTYRPESELSRFNTASRTDWHELSDATSSVVREAQRVSHLSGGAFDATVGPLVDLWGFGPTGSRQTLPAERAVASTLGRVGYQQIELDESAVRKIRPDVHLDLSGIAKGHAVDAVARRLEEREVKSYLVEVGGELRARGRKPDGSPWAVAIEEPRSDRRAVHRVVDLSNAAIATSGDYRAYFDLDGERYSHAIDPRTGRPVANGLASVSVIAPSTRLADTLSTAIMVLGPERGYTFAREHSLAAYLITRGSEGLVSQATPELEPYLASGAT